MRHQRSGRKLKRTHSHRKATLSALCKALILHKKIKTTTAKAKETRMFVEKLITRAKNAAANEAGKDIKDIWARREVFSVLRSREAVTALFRDIAPKVASRSGGYTRVVKLGRRLGDGAEISALELVDFNTGQEKTETKGAKKNAPRKKITPSAEVEKKEAPPKESDGKKEAEAGKKKEKTSEKPAKAKGSAPKKSSK
jgi:large subunit ribosomal protein L17